MIYQFIKGGTFLTVCLSLLVPALAQDESESSSPEIEEITVTAQRVEENIQDVPLSVSAFGSEALEEQQVITPSDIQLNTPNVSFTAANFGGSSFSVRGIGSLITGSAAEPGVSAHLNEIPVSSNLNTFEFFDMERVEILRGPQGTLFGKNATGGAINFVTKKPEYGVFDAYLNTELGSDAHTRVTAMVNIPVDTNFSARVAVMSLKRDGYTENLAGAHGIPRVDDNIDGRNEWTARFTLAWELNESASAWFLFSQRREDSDRVRISNQVCVRNDLPTTGCTPNGFGFDNPYLSGTTFGIFGGAIGALPFGASGAQGLAQYKYPRPDGLDLRTVHTDVEPVFVQNDDFFALGVNYVWMDLEFELLASLHEADGYSQQDYLFDVGPTLLPTALNPSGIWPTSAPVTGDTGANFTSRQCNIQDGTAGIFGGCIYQGIDQTVFFTFDHSSGVSTDKVLEGKVSGSINDQMSYLLGAISHNRERATDYMIFSNTLDAVSRYGAPGLQLPPLYPGFFVNSSAPAGGHGRNDEGTAIFGELYFDMTDTTQLTLGLRYNEDTRTTDDSSILLNAINHVPLLQASVYPGVRAHVASVLGVPVDFVPLQTALQAAYAAGLLHPNHLINVNAASGIFWSRTANLLLGAFASGPPEIALARYYGVSQEEINAALLTPAYSPERIAISQRVPITPAFGEARGLTNSPDSGSWTALTGRLALDIRINEEVMVYGALSSGYKPGGMNAAIPQQFHGTSGFTFDREDVTAIEVGTKSFWFDRRLNLNGSFFTYQYEGLQVTRIKNNSAINENIDANIWGFEAEGWLTFDEMPNLMVDYAYSYLNTSVDGSMSLDPLNRTAGNDDWVLLNNVDPGVLTGINFIARKAHITNEVVAAALASGATADLRNGLTPVSVSYPANEFGVSIPAYFSRAFLNALGVETSDGLPSNLDGNSLPNSPEHTIKIGFTYSTDSPIQMLPGTLSLRWDFYWQSESFSREFNTVGDEIDAWTQMNASATFNSRNGRFMLKGWVRNLEDNDNVTGMYLTSDSSGFFRNYFLTEPRVAGVSFRYSLK